MHMFSMVLLYYSTLNFNFFFTFMTWYPMLISRLPQHFVKASRHQKDFHPDTFLTGFESLKIRVE